MTESKNNILIIFSISIMAITGIVAVTPALPYIASDLSVSKEKIGLIFSLVALPGIILTPV
ncbi:MAG: hypothetical protein L0Y76_10040 [Ignavibacteria bacterium]|nr:hypothetical protein [Ignavibacteria bacterium]